MKKIIFLGTPLFGANVLKTLIDLNWKPILVICQPDKKRDRKKQIIISPVKQLAIDHNIPVWQPEKISNIYQEIKDLNADIMLTAAYGQFVPEKILHLFPDGAWNVHGSLLPKLRGGAPIHWAIIDDFKTTGVSLMRMVKQMDAGNVIAIENVPINSNDTYKSLLQKMLVASQELIIKNFHKILDKSFNEIIQNPNDVSFGYNIKVSDTYINWNKSSHQIDCLIRGLYDEPVAKTILDQIHFKVIEAYKTNILLQKKAPGTIVKIDSTGLYVVCGDHYLLQIKTIQMPSKKITSINAIINGDHIFKIDKVMSNYES